MILLIIYYTCSTFGYFAVIMPPSALDQLSKCIPLKQEFL